MKCPARHLSSRDVKAVQQVLTALGYQPGDPDGVKGHDTQTALEAFHRDHPQIASAAPPAATPAHTVAPHASGPVAELSAGTLRDPVWSRQGNLSPRVLTVNFEAAANPATAEDQVRNAISEGILQYTHDAIHRGVQYNFTSGADVPANSRALSCSGFVFHAVDAAMQSVRGLRLQGPEAQATFSPRPGTMESLRTVAASQIDNLGRHHGMTQITSADQLKAGQIIGMENADYGWNENRFEKISHIVAVVRDPANGQLMIAQSAADSRDPKNVSLTPAAQWFANWHGKPMFAVDLAQAVRANVTPMPSRLQEAPTIQLAAVLPPSPTPPVAAGPAPH